MPPIVVYGLLLALVTGLAWPGSPAGRAVLSVTGGLAGALRQGGAMIGGEL